MIWFMGKLGLSSTTFRNVLWVTRSESYQHKKNVIGFKDIGFPDIPSLSFAFVPDSEKLYCVSDNGRVFSRKKQSGKIVDHWIEKSIDIRGDKENKKVYAWTTLYTDSIRGRVSIHTLMLKSFVGPPPSPKHIGRHLDDNGLRNVLSNLAWGTHRENAFDRSRNGKNIGELNGLSKLTSESVVLARSLREQGMTLDGIVAAIEARFGIKINRVTISKICSGQSWKDGSDISNILIPFLKFFPNYDEALAEFIRISKAYFGES